jgi:hypothetical protein
MLFSLVAINSKNSGIGFLDKQLTPKLISVF